MSIVINVVCYVYGVRRFCTDATTKHCEMIQFIRENQKKSKLNVISLKIVFVRDESVYRLRSEHETEHLAVFDYPNFFCVTS